MSKQQINFRASDLTSRQLAELAAQWGTTQSETISIVVDRVYQQERGATNMTTQNTAAATASNTGWEITTGFLTGNLFGSEPTDGYDVQASVEAYRDLCRDAIEQVFPGAAVRVDWQDGEGVRPASLQTRIYPPQATYQNDLTDEIRSVEDVLTEVYNAGLWAVEATA